MSNVYLSLGSNLAPRRNLGTALKLLHARYPLFRTSAWCETLPWGFAPQANFLNLAAHLVTSEPPLAVLDAVQHIERQLARRRHIRNGPRTIDIDLLLYDDRVLTTPRLTIPHPGLLQRDFMLLPLLELAPYPVDPRSGRPLRAAVDTLAFRQILRRR